LGANQYYALPEGSRKTVVRDVGYILGGLQFKFRTPKYPKGCILFIYLMGDDTYSIQIIRINGTKFTEIVWRDNVYCDELVDVIDGLIENKRVPSNVF
jgi:hypothetical protein